VGPHGLERVIEPGADRNGSSERSKSPGRQREGEDARNGPEAQADREAAEHPAVIEQRTLDLRPIEASKGSPENREARQDPQEERDEEVEVRRHESRCEGEGAT